MRTPTASRIAFAIAAIGGTMDTSPTPRTPYGCDGLATSNDYRVNHGQVKRSRHTVVEQAGVVHLPVGVHVVLFVERPADALHYAALNLPFNVAGVDGLASILHRGVAEDGYLACFGVNFDVHNMSGECAAGACRIEVGASHDGTAGFR